MFSHCLLAGREAQLLANNLQNKQARKGRNLYGETMGERERENAAVENLVEERNQADDFTRFLWFISCKACVRYREEVIFVLHSRRGRNCCFSGRD